MVWYFNRILSLGVTPELDHVDRARVMVINMVCVVMTVILFVNTTVFTLLGSYNTLKSLLVVPLFVTVLYLNRRSLVNISKFVFSYGMLAMVFYLAVTNRRIGGEYALVAVACSSAFSFKKQHWMITTFVVSMLAFVVYFIIDAAYPFVPNPTVNYTATNIVYGFMSTSIVFVELVIFRSIIRKYADSFVESNKALNRTNEELNAINESLDVMVRERTEALENKTEELQAQKEKLKEVVMELDRNNAKLNATIKALQQRNYEMDQIVYRLSHNLKAPMCSIAGLSNLMQMDMNLDLIKQALPRVDQKIEEMESVFRSVSSLTSLNLEEVTLSAFSPEELIKEVVTKLRSMQGANDVAITVTPCDQIVVTDRKMLFTAVHHIVRNAIMFRDKNHDSHLTISCQADGFGCRLIFEDDGLGISDRIKDRIFDMFYQGSSESKGSGLGLYITREIIQRLQGTIDVLSDGPGTVVNIFIPSLFTKESNQSGADNQNRPLYPPALLRGA